MLIQKRTNDGRLRIAVGAVIVAAVVTAANAGGILIEAEDFNNVGGWVIDQQFMDQMGSPFLLAHGLGVPVTDATTTVNVRRPGAYRLWVRTQDWVATWNAPGTPGKFQVIVNG